MRITRKQLYRIVTEAMKFRDDGRSMDQVQRDIASAMAGRPYLGGSKSTHQRPLASTVRRRDRAHHLLTAPPPVGESEPADLSPITELPHYNAAQNKELFMLGYNDGADDAALDFPPDYPIDDLSTSNDYTMGYQLGYTAFS